MTLSHLKVRGNPVAASAPDLRLTDQTVGETNGPWQCQACRSLRVDHRMVFSVERGATLHRIICALCGAVGHYEAPTGRDAAPTTTRNGKFRVVAASADEASDGTRAAISIT